MLARLSCDATAAITGSACGSAPRLDLGEDRRQKLDDLDRLPFEQHRTRPVGRDPRRAEPVARRPMARCRFLQETRGLRAVSGERRRLGGAFAELRLLDRVLGDPERLEQERERLVERAELARPIGRTAERDPSLGGEGLGLGPGGRVAIRVEIVAGQDAGDLVVAERLEVLGRCEMASPALALRQRPVGDLADHRLHEEVLAPLGGARIDLDPEQLPVHEPSQATVDLGLVHPRERRQRVGGEAEPQDRGILEQRPVRRVEPVETCRNERVEGLRDRQPVERAAHRVDVAVADEAFVGHEHPDGFDGVQGDPFGSSQDRPDRRLGQARDEPIEERPHRIRVEWFQVEAREVALAGSPVGPPLEDLRPGQGDDEDRVAARPLEEVADELEQPAVGPLEVLEHEDDRAERRDALEERSPRGEQLPGAASIAARILAQPEQGHEPGLDPLSFGVVRDVLGQRGAELLERLDRVIGLGDPRPRPDHLAERPERDAVADRRGPALMPVDRLGQPVDVLLELPGQARLADAGRPDDRHDPDPRLARRRVEQVLEQAQLVVATDERRLERLGPAGPAPAGHDPQRSPGTEGGPALHLDLTDRLERDRPRGRPVGRVADEHRASLGGRLETGRGVDEVAGDHRLAGIPDGNRRLAGQDPDPQGRWPVAARELRYGVNELEAGPDRLLGVVLAGDRCAPDRHDRVPDELLDGAAVPPDHLAGVLEVGIEEGSRVLRVARLRGRGEPDEVGEEHAHQPQLG